MRVINVHQRLLHASPERVGALLDSLSSPEDALWPRQAWPRLRLDGPLAVGAEGGHGPIRYRVEAYEPGRLVRFRFTGALGFDGWHALEVLEATAFHCILEHRIEMQVRGLAWWRWQLLYRPLHDALIEDALTTAQAALGQAPRRVAWAPAVHWLRRLAGRQPTGLRSATPAGHPLA